MMEEKRKEELKEKIDKKNYIKATINVFRS